MNRRRRLALCPSLDFLDDRCLLSVSGFSPAQITSAYGLGGLHFTSTNGQTVAADGTGGTIALIVAFHDPNLASDLHVFDSQFGLPDPSLNQVNLAGAFNTNDSWAGEETLDVEWAHAIAPGAKIVVVEATTDSTSDLLVAVDNARTIPGVVAISMSWSGPEASSDLSDDAHFTTPAGHTGITFIAASGDTGTRGGAEWPASSPNVLAVGGTSLFINGAGGYRSESAWASGGAGISRYEAEPAYQRNIQSTGARIEPDVGFLGDPNTGVAVYSTNPSDGQGGWQVVAGTSLGTPAWAGIVAIIDEGLAVRGQGSLDGATQFLPELYSLPSTAFHPVANSSVSLSRNSATISTVGLGTPIGANLIADFVPATSTGGIPTAPPPPVVVVVPTATLVSEVSHFYQAILGRAPDPVGLASAVSALTSGETLNQFVSGLFHSAEYDTIQVIHDYQADLGRSPSPTEIDAAVAALQGGESEPQLSANLLSSDEFNLVHPNDADFAEATYQATLGRAASTAELSSVLTVLNSGTSRGSILNFLLGSVEASLRTITKVYQVFLGRSPDPTGEFAAVQALQSGAATPLDLATQLAGSDESLARSRG